MSKNTLTKLLTTIFIVILPIFSGCSSVMLVGANDKFSNAVIRYEAKSTENPDLNEEAPARGGWIANAANNGPATLRYRWILGNEYFGEIFDGGLHFRGPMLVDARVPLLHKGDIVDVLEVPPREEDRANLQVNVVFRLVCRAEDFTCKDREKAKYGKLTGFMLPEKAPARSNLIFDKVYDESGRGLIGVPFTRAK